MGKVGLKLVGFLLFCLGSSLVAHGQVMLTVDSTTDPTCADPNGGMIQVSVAGGTDPYTIFITSVPPGYSEFTVGAPGQTVFTLPDGGHAPLTDGTYAITAVDQSFDVDSRTVTLATPLPILTVPPPPPIDICEDAADVDLTTLVSVDQGGGIFTFAGPGVTGSMFDPSGLSGNQTINVTYTLAACVVMDMFDFNVQIPPQITMDPSDAMICSTSMASFTVNAGATTGPLYQWQVDPNTGTFGNISAAGPEGYSGFNTATLNVANTTGLNNYRYRAIVTGTCPGSVTSNPATLSVDEPLVITTDVTNDTQCEGDNATFTVTVTGTGPITYAWEESTDGGFVWNPIGPNSPTLTIVGVTSGQNGNLYRVNVSSGSLCATMLTSSQGLLTVLETPEVTADPVDQTRCSTSTASFTVNAGVTTGPIYQWQVDDGGGGGFVNILAAGPEGYSGFNSATLAVANLAGLDGYRYRAEITGTCPGSATSNAATLTVDDPAVITVDVVDDTQCEGDNASFTVTVTGTGPINYAWEESTDGGVMWNPIGPNSPTLTLVGVTSGQNGNRYRVNVSSGSACATMTTSSEGVLTVQEAPEVTADPVSAAFCSTGSASFTVNAGVTTGPAYQWQVDDGGGGGFVNIVAAGPEGYSGFNSATLDIANLGAVATGYQYRAIVTGTCPGSVTSNAATLTIEDPLMITTDVVDDTQCEGDNATFTVVGTGTAPMFQWQEDTGSGFANMPGETASVLTLTGVTSTQNGNRYRVQITTSSSCGGMLTSAEGLLTVQETPEVGIDPTDFMACESGTASFTVDPGVTTVPSFQWQVDDGGGGGFVNIVAAGPEGYSGFNSATLDIATLNVSMSGYLYRAVITGTCPGSATSNSATLTVDAAPTITVQPMDDTICEGDNVTFTVTATGDNLTYQWQLDAGGGFNNMTGETASTLSLTSVPATANGNQYRVIVGGLNCPTAPPSNAAILTVQNAIPTITGSTAICLGTTTMATYSTEAGQSNYNWAITGGTIDSGVGTNTINVTWVSPGLNSLDVDYLATNGCNSQVTSLPVSVFNSTPAPLVTTPVNVCQGDPNPTLTIDNFSGQTVTWYSDAGLTTAVGSGEFYTPGATELDTSSPGTTGFFVTQTVPGCGEGPAAQIDVDVVSLSPAPIVNPNPATLCVSDPAPTLTAIGTNVLWYSDAGLTTQVASGNVYTPTSAELDTSVPGTTSFFATQDLGCGVSSATMVDVNIGNSSPTPSFVAQPDLCLNSPIPTLTAIGTNVQWHSDATQSDVIATGNSYTPTAAELDTDVVGTTSFFASQDIGCGRGAAGQHDITVVDTCQGNCFTTSVNASSATCPGDVISVTFNLDGNEVAPVQFHLYQFDGTDTTFSQIQSSNVFTGLTAGDYEYEISDAQLCFDAGQLTLTEPAPLSYNLSEIRMSVPDLATGDMTITDVMGGTQPYQIRAELVQSTSSFPGQTYLQDWTAIPMDPTTGVFEIQLTNMFAGFYEVFIRDSSMCVIQVLENGSSNPEVPLDDALFIPNVFTPNKDGYNDIFFIRNKPTDSPTTLIVVNRWGKEVFQSTDYQNDWAAEGISDGVYYYTISFEGQTIQGWVEVWRGAR